MRIFGKYLSWPLPSLLFSIHFNRRGEQAHTERGWKENPIYGFYGLCPYTLVRVPHERGTEKMSETHELVIFILSDSTGDTGQMMIRAVLSQFQDCPYRLEKFSFVRQKEELLLFLDKIEEAGGVLAYTIILPEIQELLKKEIKRRQLQAIDLLGHAYSFFYSVLGFCPLVDHSPGPDLDEEYFNRVEAMNFTVRCDDGQDISSINEADVILIGISRTSKTPLSMYLAYRGYRVINLPLIPEVTPPQALFSIPPARIVGLVVNPGDLQAIRQQRLKNMGIAFKEGYASAERIKEEMDYAQGIMERLGCPILNVTHRSIEEAATEIMNAIS